MIGQTIGPYRILDQLGEGGMGTVYLAEQTEPVQRKVALKLIKAGMDSKQVLARFEAERQALALMGHANVATVYDASSTSLGQPYFAMEYVRGVDITAHCDQQDMDFRDRIALFLQVCEGVLHAHQKGLIHRDIKPGNILVSRAQDQPATVKIIDFGVAKSLSGLLGAHPAHTRLGSFVGTPAYSSPEQVSGPLVSVDTRTDIYSLGVVLYQLLSGVTPYSVEELNRKTPVELARMLSAEQPPSLLARFSSLSAEEESEIARHRSLSIERMKASLGSDISWIVGKCLECDPDDRYPSVLELEKDLRRWLEDKPVEARPTSRIYRIRKFVRRHRLAVALGTAMTLALLVTTTVAVIGFMRAEHALKTARAATAEAEKAADFQVQQMQSIDPATMGLAMRSALIDAVRKRDAERGNPAAGAQRQQQLEALFEDVNFTDLALNQLENNSFKPTLAAIKKDFDDQPLLQARLWQTMADTLRDLGQLDAAVEPQRLALEQRRKLLGADDPLTLVSLRSRGALRREQGQLEASVTDIEAALKGMRRVLGDNAPETITSILELGDTRFYQGEYTMAESHYRESLARSRRVLGDNHSTTVESMGNVGTVLYTQHRYKEALPYIQQALTRHRQLFGDLNPNTLNMIGNMAALYWNMNRRSEAIVLAREAVDGARKLRGEGHPDTLATTDNLAIMLQDTGQMQEAEALLRHSLRIESTMYGEDSAVRLATLAGLSAVLRAQGRFAEAESILRQVLNARRRSLGDNHPDTLVTADNLADILGLQGKNDEAISLYGPLLATTRRTMGNDNPLTLLVMRHYAARLSDEGELNAAGTLLRETLEAQRRTLGNTDLDTLATLTDLGGLLEQQGEFVKAEACLREALAGYRAAFGTRNADTLVALARLMQTLRARGNLQEALTLGEELTGIAPGVLNAKDHRIGRFLIQHGKTLTALRRFDEAEAMFDKAEANFTQGDAASVGQLAELIKARVALYERWQAAQPEARHAAQAETWRRKLAVLTKGIMQPAAVVDDK